MVALPVCYQMFNNSCMKQKFIGIPIVLYNQTLKYKRHSYKRLTLGHKSQSTSGTHARLETLLRARNILPAHTSARFCILAAQNPLDS